MARATNKAKRVTKKPARVDRGGGRGPSLLILACCGGIVVVAMWAPVTRAQLILSAVAVIAIWLRPVEK